MMGAPQTDKPGGKLADKPERHVYGPRPLGALVGPLLRPAFKGRRGASAQLLADWPLIVGPELAALTLPRALSATRLTIACDGPVALELQHLAVPLMARINAHLGRIAITELRFMQAMRDRPATATPPAPAPPPAVAAAEAAVADVPEGGLREALVRLGARVLATSR